MNFKYTHIFLFMNRVLVGVGLLAMLVGCTQTPQLGKDPIEKVVAAMTTEEKASLLIGTGMAGMESLGGDAAIGSTQNIVPGAAGTTFPIERFGISPVVVADGPAGLRITPIREGDEATYYCTAFPVATLLASSWNTSLVKEVGAAMGNEVKEYGCDVLLAPALNIHRSPLCGRNFEYYSEDPLVTGKMAAAMVNGIQSNGVGTSIKHFAANNQETNRTGVDSRITPRALREIYLKGFEIAVKEAQPWTVMTSYNKLNGIYTSENRDLVTTILRDEWGYEGMVMTDWLGGKDAAAQIHAGNDLLMPGRQDQKAAIMKAVEDGSLSMEDVDTDVTRILNLVLRSPRFNNYVYSNKPDLEAHAAVTRASASEGMVLLKNAGNTLPLSSNIKKVAAYGTTSYDFIAGGTGSGDVNEAYTVSLVEGLENAGYTLDEDIKAQYAKYREDELAKQPKEDNPMLAFLNKPRMGEFVPDPASLAAKAKESDVAIITIGRNAGEFQDRAVAGDFTLTDNEKALIKTVSNAFHREGKKVIVILNIGGVIETANWKSDPDAILLAWQAGQEGGNTVADILSGKVNPSGKLTMTFPNNVMDIPSTKNFPDASKIDLKEQMRSFMGGSAPTNRKDIDYTNYEEGIYVGYRYFDTFRVPVSFPFGYGLSYTTFNYSDMKVTPNADGYDISCKITNTGKVAGKEVVQLYIAAPGKSMEKPAQELKGFSKTNLLQPGESQDITISISNADLASFDETNSEWVVEDGDYEARLAASSADIRLKETFTAKGGVTEKVHNVLLPQENINLLTHKK